MLWLVAVLSLAAADPLADAQRLYDAGDFEAALKRLDVGLRADPPPGTRAQLQLSRARCLFALRKNADVEPALEAGLEADPTLTLGDDVSPSFRTTFEQLRVRLAAPVTVSSEPAGAAVRIDGALIGRTPLETRLPVGRYVVAVIDETGAELTQVALVTPRRPQTVAFTLAAKPAAVEPQTVAEPTPAPNKPWPIELAVAGRALTDFRGAALEVGAALIGRYFLVELDAVIGDSPGAGLRAGGRLPFVNGLFSVQLTADAVAFFSPTVAPGGGATASFAVHPLAFLDLLVDGSARFLAAAPGYRAQYFLAGLTLRLRWPTGLDGQ
ncbi:MAG: PEGA domain-containing protein [Myxococcaceae bacterium]|nr:PEGA domain-containing protein [Myxococcaceae bacterium]